MDQDFDFGFCFNQLASALNELTSEVNRLTSEVNRLNSEFNKLKDNAQAGQIESPTSNYSEVNRLTSEVNKLKDNAQAGQIEGLSSSKHIREVIILYHDKSEMNNDFMEAIIEEIKVDQANQGDENYRNILEGVDIQSQIYDPKSPNNLPIYDPSQHSGVVYIYVPNSAGLERVDKIPGLEEETSDPANRERFKEWQNQLFLLIPTKKVILEKDWRSVLKTSTHSCYGVFDLKNIGHILYLKNKERANLYEGVFDPRTTLLIGKDSPSQTNEQTVNVNKGTKQRLTELFKRNAV
jgi:hypothetical protein